MLVFKNFLVKCFVLVSLPIISIILFLISYLPWKKPFFWLLINSFKFLRHTICKFMGVKITYKGLENIPSGAVIFASKHQSMFEATFFFEEFKDRISYCYKKEISRIPMWGRISKIYEGVPIDRRNPRAFITFIKDVKHYLSIGRSVVIFPEGTRVSPGKRPKFKKGISKIYKHTTNDIVPVALNSGDSFPRGSKLIKPAHIIVEFLPPIKGRNLSEEEFSQLLYQQINDKSDEVHRLAQQS